MTLEDAEKVNTKTASLFQCLCGCLFMKFLLWVTLCAKHWSMTERCYLHFSSKDTWTQFT